MLCTQCYPTCFKCKDTNYFLFTKLFFFFSYFFLCRFKMEQDVAFGCLFFVPLVLDGVGCIFFSLMA